MNKLLAAVAPLIALVVFSAQIARSQILADVLTLNSGEKIEGRITAESDLSVTISTVTSTGKAERMIPRSEIVGETRSEPLAPAKTPSPDSPKASDRGSVSPDHKWEYEPDESAPKIVKAGTNEVALDLSDQSAGNGFSYATVIWAPDSKRFAFNYGQGRTHATSLYQLRENEWKALKLPDDEDKILQRADDIVAGQLKRKGLSKEKLSKKDMYLRLIWWTVKLDRWVDSNTAILYAGLQQVAARRDDPGEMFDGFGADLLFTLRFDDTGNWKIVKTHQMSDKEVETREKEQ